MIITYHAPATLKAFAIGKALEHGGHGQNASDPKGLADKDPHEMTQEELVLHLAHLRRELDARMVDVSPDTAPDNAPIVDVEDVTDRSEEHTSELQSLMRISYAVFCLKKKKNT